VVATDKITDREKKADQHEKVALDKVADREQKADQREVVAKDKITDRQQKADLVEQKVDTEAKADPRTDTR
jgi:hypothetical protein